MSRRAPSIIVKEILSCIEHLQEYTSNISFEEFTANDMVVEAGLYNVQIIGEAVGQLPDDVKKSAPDIPWILIKGMRNRLIHEYFGTDLPVVWNVIKNELPAFKTSWKRCTRISIVKEDKIQGPVALSASANHFTCDHVHDHFDITVESCQDQPGGFAQIRIASIHLCSEMKHPYCIIPGQPQDKLPEIYYFITVFTDSIDWYVIGIK